VRRRTRPCWCKCLPRALAALRMPSAPRSQRCRQPRVFTLEEAHSLQRRNPARLLGSGGGDHGNIAHDLARAPKLSELIGRDTERLMAADRLAHQVAMAGLGEPTSPARSPDAAAAHAEWRDEQR